jgi:L-fuconolactonase
VFDALIQPRHLRRILVLCQRHPALRVVVDHGAKPAIAQGLWQPWADDLRLLARDTSGRLQDVGAAHRSRTASSPRRWHCAGIAHLLEIFGPQRMLWGSDWPVLELAATYDDWWADTQTALAGLTATDRAAVLGGNAMQVYRL